MKGETCVHFDKKTLKHIFVGVAACILLYWVLHETERFKTVMDVITGIFAPFAVGAGIAFIINVPMRSIESKFVRIKNDSFRRVVALLITLVVILLVLALVFYLLIPQVTATAKTFIESLPPFFAELQEKVIAFLKENPELMETVSNHIDLSTLNLGGLLQKALDVAGNSVATILAGAFTAIGGIAGILVNGVISIVFSIYCLFNKETLCRQGRKLLYAYLPEAWCDSIVRVLRLTNTTFSNFLSGQCLEVCILGCMFAVSMAIFRMPYIPLVSVLVAVTAFIPVVGAFAGCIFGAFFILVDNPVQAVGFVIMFLVIQQIEGNLIYPRVVGNSIGLPGMWVLLAVAIGGELMGVAGMFVMIPLASVIYVLITEITNKRLQRRNIDESKLQSQPIETESRLKKKRKHFWNKIKIKRMNRPKK